MKMGRTYVHFVILKKYCCISVGSHFIALYTVTKSGELRSLNALEFQKWVGELEPSSLKEVDAYKGLSSDS